MNMVDYSVDGKISEERLLKGVEYMNSLGARLTGNAAHNRFISYLKSEINAMGLETFSDRLYFNRWEETGSSLSVFENDGTETPVAVSSVFPYSGETAESGVVGELMLVKESHLGYIGSKNKIVVVEINELNVLPSEIAFNKRNSLPEDVTLPEKYDGPVATAFVNFPFLNLAKIMGAKAAICVWKGIHDDCVEGQYLPFILDYQGIPTLWVNETNGAKVIEAAKGHRCARLMLTAEKQRNAPSESFYCILEGKNTYEAVIINTHTDGTNCVEENGAIAMLQLIEQLKDKPLERTHIFVFVTGHFRLPFFKDIEGGGVQATSKWLSMHGDLWDGKDGHLHAVAGVAVEHLGCMQWGESDGEYKKIGDVQTEICYTGNQSLDKVYYDALEGRGKVNTLTLRGHNFLHFGEGQPLFNVGIPDISLVTAPEYLCVVSKNNEMDKFDVQLMAQQTETFLKILLTIDGMTQEEIGRSEKYSLLLGKLRGKGE